MKTLVVYYSLEGNTKYTAERIARSLGADILRLETVKPYPDSGFGKFFWGGKSAIFGEKPELQPYKIKMSDYDKIILGTPVWAGCCAPAMKTFLAQNKIKNKDVGLFACSSSGNAAKCFQMMQRMVGIEQILPTLSLVNPSKNKNTENREAIREFCKKLSGR